jgi:diguanylate cyclase (GGDEF)-like protein
MIARSLSDLGQPVALDPIDLRAELGSFSLCARCGGQIAAGRRADEHRVLDKQSWHRHAEGLLALHRRTGGATALLFLDLDHFKRINDTYGHVAGNQVLDAISVILERSTRPEDLLGRYGDEFLILLADTSLSDALHVARRIRDAVRALHLTVPAIGGGTATITTVTTSLGVAGYSPGHHRTVDDLVVEADTALYAAKNGGRDQICPAPPRPRSAR